MNTRSSDLTEYYRTSDEYRTMLAEQDPSTFSRYVSLFDRWVPRDSKVLDVGCGVGTSTRMLRAAGFAAVGVDASQRFLPSEEGASSSPTSASGLACPMGASGPPGRSMSSSTSRARGPSWTSLCGWSSPAASWSSRPPT